MTTHPEIESMFEQGDLTGIVDALRGGNPARREAASEKLVRLGPTAMPPLVEALNHLSSDLRKAAALTLGEIGDRSSVAPLIQRLDDKDWAVREAAAVALGKIGDPSALDPLFRALRDQDEWVRRRTAQALGAIGDARAIEWLNAAFHDRDALVVEYAHTAIETIKARSL